MKPKVFKKRGLWLWICRFGWCMHVGRHGHWEIAHLEAVEHYKGHGRKPVPHDNDLTPPGGIHRYEA